MLYCNKEQKINWEVYREKLQAFEEEINEAFSEKEAEKEEKVYSDFAKIIRIAISGELPPIGEDEFSELPLPVDDSEELDKEIALIEAFFLEQI
jgi:hypothetical protein